MISVFIFLIFTLWGLWLVNRGIEPTLMAIAKAKVENIGTKIINASINKQISEDYNARELVELIPTENGYPVAMIDSGGIIEVASTATLRAQNMLEKAENGQLPDITLPEGVEIKRQDDSTVGIVYYIPLGMATGNALLSNLGPRVPVRFHVVGNIESTTLQKTEQIGINQVHMMVKLTLSAEVRVVVPFETDSHQIKTSYVLVDMTIPGPVPLYYGGGGNDAGMMLPLPKDGKWHKIR